MDQHSPPALFGKYRIEAELGRGGFGTVYRALDTVLERVVAVKILDPLLLRDASWIQSFKREARLMARLDHPHIVPVYDAGEVEGRLYIAMKYVDGPSLAQQLKDSGPLTWEQTLVYAHQVADALDYAHSRGIIHRDLKPGNILLGSQGALITDFGLSQLLETNNQSTIISQGIVGTPAYLAPEIWQGKSPGKASDVYALACIITEMLTGQQLYQADNFASFVTIHLQPPVFPTKWPSDVHPQIGKVLKKALQQDPLARPALASPWVNELTQLRNENAGWKYSARKQTARLAERDKVEPGIRTVTWNPAKWRQGYLRAGKVILFLGIISLVMFLALKGLNQGAIAHQGNKSESTETITKQAVAFATPTLTQSILSTVIPVQNQTRTSTPTLLASPTLFLTPTTTPSALPTSTPTLVLPVRSGTMIPQSGLIITAENADEVVQLAQMGKGTVNQLAYASDGTVLAIASSVGIYLYDGELERELLFIPTTSAVRSVAFSPDNTLLASGSEDGELRIWQVGDGAIERTLAGHTRSVTSVTFSPDGAFLASSSGDSTARLWQTSDGRLVHTFEGSGDVAFSPDGTLLASTTDRAVLLWQVSDGMLAQTFDSSRSFWGERQIAFSPNGGFLASDTDYATVDLWDVRNGELVQTLRDLNGGSHISGIAFSPDGTLIGIKSYGTVHVWQAGDGTFTLSRAITIDGRIYYEHNLLFSHDSTRLIFSNDTSIYVWQVSDGTLVQGSQGFTIGVNSTAISPDGTLIASGEGNRVHLGQTNDGSQVQVLEGHDGWINSVTFSSDGTMFASGADSRDVAVRIWDVSSGALLQMLERPTFYGVNSLAFSPDDTLLAMGADDGVVRLWRVSDGSLVRTLEGHTRSVSGVIFSPDGTLLGSVSGDQTVRLWRVGDGSLVRIFTDVTRYGNNSVSFSPDGTLLVSAANSLIHIWRVSDGSLIRTLEGHTSWVNYVAFSANGELLASGSNDTTVRLWQVNSGTLLNTLEGHTLGVNSVAFSAEGNMLISASDDGTVRLWGIPSGE